MSAIEIRRARVVEIPRLVEIWLLMMREHETFDSHVKLALDAGDHYYNYLRHSILDPNAMVLAALRDEEIVGYTLAMVCDNLPMFEPRRFGYISDMALRPEERGAGTGSRMYEEVTRWLRAQEITSLQLQVYAGNEKGQAFWKRCGLGPYLHRQWVDL